ncbi:hypothetical protein BHE74_00018313 [Ensete ventricosum]|nr:hypothetical protein BHE74_00018313 [Ensete ventricosum]
MLSLSFPTVVSEPMFFMRKIGFKLRVMRLNRVESFYAFLLHFCRERSEEERPAMVRPPAGVASHGQATCRGGQPWSGYLQGWPAMAKSPVGAATHGQAPTGATGCGQGPRKGGRTWPAHKGQSPAGTVAHGQGCYQQARPPVGMAGACRGDAQVPRDHDDSEAERDGNHKEL